MSPVSQMHNFVTLKIEKQVLEEHRESDLELLLSLDVVFPGRSMDTGRLVNSCSC